MADNTKKCKKLAALLKSKNKNLALRQKEVDRITAEIAAITQQMADLGCPAAEG